VSAESGILVDPLSVEAIADGLRRAAELPRPNRSARAVASAHDVRLQAERIEAVLKRAAAAQ
jgi:glycosyltransferase involved in cell wall biosynthesis